MKLNIWISRLIVFILLSDSACVELFMSSLGTTMSTFGNTDISVVVMHEEVCLFEFPNPTNGNYNKDY
jgi:hypothetical protein